MTGTKKSTKSNNEVENKEVTKTVELVGTKKTSKKMEKTNTPASTPATSPETKTTDSELKQKLNFDSETQSLREQVHQLKHLISSVLCNVKKLEQAHKTEMKSDNTKKTKKIHKPTGFEQPKFVVDKLAEFLGIPNKTPMMGPTLTKMLWDKFFALNLVYEKDKRILRVNNEISKLLNVTMDVNNSISVKDEKGLNFKTLQKVIKESGYFVKPTKEEAEGLVAYTYTSTRDKTNKKSSSSENDTTTTTDTKTSTATTSAVASTTLESSKKDTTSVAITDVKKSSSKKDKKEPVLNK
ncbi:hypothetical protein BMW23_0359 [Bodo saltans virus]|uniref:Uncharacterized protein n=1 Tax=Bodo saltans virus TaxID=2024608 RepID=A0A2H4UU69_9VIRU|nr:hypothetical protein QJ851_gp0351 [Bodo saltans virus]ATZ80414.1 hypothetical protein BMW23_0359 [Bodo saltans virus]